MKDKISSVIKRAFNGEIPAEITVEKPNNPSFGDYSTNIAMKLSKSMKKAPADIAGELVDKISAVDKGNLFSDVGSVKGFVNFTLSGKALRKELSEIIKLSGRYGRSTLGRGKKVLIEFVSANPTGPLHVGHGRWAVIGDAIAGVLEAAGYRVEREFYVNDVGRQIDLLCRSVIARAQGVEVPEGGYGGEYVRDLAVELRDRLKSKELGKELIKKVLSGHKAVLSKLNVKFDSWFHESSLYKNKSVDSLLKALENKKLTYKEDGALWFRSESFGDDKNRVLIREDGVPTYFTADIAYHDDKFRRGYDTLIDVWGSDHHGYVSRVRAAMKALGHDDSRLKIIIGQLVSLFRGGAQVRMSKRAGEMITLEEVVDEIGPDATRFFFLLQSPDSGLDFDLELAKKHSSDNPVYYVQYAHARISSILREAGKAGFKAESLVKKADLGLLKEPAEFDLIKKLIAYPDEISDSAKSLLPHRLIAYSRELATQFHNFYHKLRVICDDRAVASARIALVCATRIVLKNVLELLRISAPESM